MIFSIDRACADRRADTINDTAFGRIIAAYNRAKTLQRSAPDAYQVSNEWLPIYEANMGEVMRLLENGDVGGLKEIYGNFFRDPCSSGLHGMTLNLKAHFAGDEIHPNLRNDYFRDTLHRVNLWAELTEAQFPVTALGSPDVGNPYGYTLGSTFVRIGSDYHHYYATTINRLVRSSRRQRVAEIGGGFGGMAYFLIRDNPVLTYINFDLPENVALASYYLMSSFPEKRIALFGEIDLETDDLDAFDAILLPNVAMGAMKDDSVDLVFNSYSLAEMSRETIDCYIKEVNRFSAKFFYHVNHTKNSLVKASEFPVDRRKFELLYRAPALWNFARNPGMDEFEFLYINRAMQFSAVSRPRA